MALTTAELDLMAELKESLDRSAGDDERLLRYYRGTQRIEQLGLAIPPSMRRFLVAVNWPRVVVDTIVGRQQVQSLVIPGEETDDAKMRAIWDASNLSAHLNMFNRDRCIFGRSFMSVGANERNPQLPLVRVESPREMAVKVDVRQEVALAAARFYGVDSRTDVGPTHATLYLPDETVWCAMGSRGWVELDRNRHELGAVPVVMHLNRRLSAGWVGESQMTDILPLTDSAARTMTNLQFAIEAHGIPRVFMTGVSQGDFLDAAGRPIPKWEAYFNAIHTLTKEGAKVGQLEAADVSNFEKALDMYGKQAATISGFPARYFGLQTTNPPAEGAIRADEAQLIRSVETQNEEVGATLGWVGALALRFATGQWVEGNRVRVEWYDPATPTVAQRMDAIVKAKQSGILSREGAWDALGMSEARKARERAYFVAELNDPTVQLARDLMGGATDAAAGNV